MKGSLPLRSWEVTVALPFAGNAEILAMLNYESKSAEALKAFRSPVPGQTRQEGIAIIDVNPTSANFKKVVETIPLPPDLVAHHIFYNRDMSKAYVTALGKGELRVIDMSKRPFTAKTWRCRTARSARTWFSRRTTNAGSSPAWAQPT